MTFQVGDTVRAVFPQYMLAIALAQKLNGKEGTIEYINNASVCLVKIDGTEYAIDSTHLELVKQGAGRKPDEPETPADESMPDIMDITKRMF